MQSTVLDQDFLRDFAGPAEFYEAAAERQKKRPVLLLRHTRAPTIKKEPIRYLQVQLGKVHQLPNGKKWKMTLALISCQYSLKDTPQFVHVHSSTTIDLMDPQESTGPFMTVPLRLRELQHPAGSPPLKRSDTNNLLVLLAHDEQDDPYSGSWSVEREIALLFNLSAEGKTVPLKWNETRRLCILELISKRPTGEVSFFSDWAIAGRRIRSMLWPAVSYKQMVKLTSCSRIQLGMEISRREGDLGLDIHTSWTYRMFPQSSSLLTPPFSPSRALQSLENRSIPRAVVFHYCYTTCNVKPKDVNVPGTELASIVQAWHTTEGIPPLQCPWCAYCPGKRGEVVEVRKDIANTHLTLAERSAEGQNISPWTRRTQQSVVTLMYHLESFHQNFDYKAVYSLKGDLHIHVTRNRHRDWSESKYVSERRANFHMPKNERAKLLGVTSLSCQFPCSPRMSRTELAAFAFHVSKRKRKVVHPKEIYKSSRIVYNARIGNRLTAEEELLCEDNFDVSSADLQIRYDDQLEELEDLSWEEKSLMKIWNQFACSNKAYGDSRVPLMCQQFLEKHAAEILAQNLRHNTLIHFLNMMDFGLLVPDELKNLMAYLDQLYLNQQKSEKSK